jgi:hypothetical protein
MPKDSLKYAKVSKSSLTFFVDLYESTFEEMALKGRLTDEEIWSLIDCISTAMETYQRERKYLCGISPKKVYHVMTPFNKRVFKIREGLMFDLTYNHYN